MASPQDALSLDERAPAVRPLRDAFRLPALDVSVSVARRRVLDRLREWCVGEECCDDTELLISELFTNAVRHTASSQVCCELSLVEAVLTLEVTDQGNGARPVIPIPRGEQDTDGECGRGLLLVAALADDWGIRPGGAEGDGGNGHAVWAQLSCPRGAAP